MEYDGGKELFRLGVDPVVYWRDNVALCLAELRPEGFCSLEARVHGTFLTKPFLWPRGKAFWLNCESHFGEIYCETGVKPLLGFLFWDGSFCGSRNSRRADEDPGSGVDPVVESTLL